MDEGTKLEVGRRLGWLRLLRSDIRANARNPKGLLICLLYRPTHGTAYLPWPIRFLGLPLVLFYKIVTEYVLGTEIHWRARIGPGLIIYHGYGLVVHSHVVIGSNVTLRHGVTIGAKLGRDGLIKAPVIGDQVDVGTSALVIGDVVVGDGATIGAGAVVVHHVSSGAVVVGNPAAPIR